MLITQLKETEGVLAQVRGKVFAIHCYGCREVSGFSEEETPVDEALTHENRITGRIVAEYICNPENLLLRLEKYATQLEQADTLLVYSCGVGVQTVAQAFPHKRVVAACDTAVLPGFQGLTPTEHDCGQCGQCFLNLTGGICPITACSKSLLNGQCGGAKNGMCEVDPAMECGWERIRRRLEQIGRLDAMNFPVQLRDYSAHDQANH